MSVLACGLNTSGQVMKAGPGILCCPSPVAFPTAVTAASVAFSHILWRTDAGWQWTGYDSGGSQGSQARGVIKSSWKVCVCENRIAAINDDGSVLVWEKQWKTLHFQKRDPDSETLGKNLSQDIDSTNYKGKESTNIDTSMKFHLEQREYESTKRKDLENTSHDTVPYNHITETQTMNKRCKLETFTKKDEWQVSNLSCPATTKITFAKVAVEDNSLLAVDTAGVMYCGSVPVPLRMKMKEVAVGKEHCMALTAAGDVITWGSGMRGQLGIGELCQAERPIPVESLQGVPITTIACGAWHCTALSETGDLYVWGWNESGQLGYPYNCEGSQSLFLFFEHACQCPERNHLEGEQLQEENKDTEESQGVQAAVRSKGMHDKRVNPKRRKEVINVQASPVLLDFWTEDVNITNVQCGDRHTLYMLDDGSVWSAGMNRYGQLGLGHVRAVKEPCRVFRHGISDMCAGGWNSIFFTTSELPAS
uniref:Uncharacterized protein n=1 Tax=Scylla olivacea TaxID=85551 RepID=A0A0P4VZK8_SCYOL